PGRGYPPAQRGGAADRGVRRDRLPAVATGTGTDGRRAARARGAGSAVGWCGQPGPGAAGHLPDGGGSAGGGARMIRRMVSSIRRTSAVPMLVRAAVFAAAFGALLVAVPASVRS